jgi:hypothetical protein
MTAPGVLGRSPAEVSQELLFDEWRGWPDMTASNGRAWNAPLMSRELAIANRRAAVYQLMALAHISPNTAFAARYSLLAVVASRCTDGPLWLRSTKTNGTLAELLYPVMAQIQRDAFDALTESAREQS